MNCASHLLLAGLCNFGASTDMVSIDAGRFGPASIHSSQLASMRIETAFQHRQGLQDFIVLDLQANPIFAEEAGQTEQHIEPSQYAALSPTKEEPAVDAITRSIVDPANGEEKAAKAEKTFSGIFRKPTRFPKGVDLKKSGYKAVHRAALKHGVDVGFALAVAKQESRGNCKARSHANAMGVMQVIPETARKHGIRKSSRLYNCQVGADVGVRELKSCLQKARGKKALALTCYNAGPAWITSKKYRGRRIPRETRNYIKMITGKHFARVL